MVGSTGGAPGMNIMIKSMFNVYSYDYAFLACTIIITCDRIQGLKNPRCFSPDDVQSSPEPHVDAKISSKVKNFLHY